MGIWDEVAATYGTNIDSEAKEYIEVTNLLPYTVADIKDVFKPHELDELGKFIIDMQTAQDDNLKRAELISQGTKIVEKLLKLGKFII